jgi:taurine dioxygenase
LTTEHDRRLYRVTLVGDVPQGPDGKPSIALDGDPFEAI